MSSFLNFSVEFRVSFIYYFKRKRYIRDKACCGGVQTFKNMRLVIIFYMFPNSGFKIMERFAIGKISNHQELIESLFEKWVLILNESKPYWMIRFCLQYSLRSFQSLFLIMWKTLPKLVIDSNKCHMCRLIDFCY